MKATQQLSLKDCDAIFDILMCRKRRLHKLTNENKLFCVCFGRMHAGAPRVLSEHGE